MPVRPAHDPNGICLCLDQQRQQKHLGRKGPQHVLTNGHNMHMDPHSPDDDRQNSAYRDAGRDVRQVRGESCQAVPTGAPSGMDLMPGIHRRPPRKTLHSTLQYCWWRFEVHWIRTRKLGKGPGFDIRLESAAGCTGWWSLEGHWSTAGCTGWWSLEARFRCRRSSTRRGRGFSISAAGCTGWWSLEGRFRCRRSSRWKRRGCQCRKSKKTGSGWSFSTCATGCIRCTSFGHNNLDWKCCVWRSSDIHHPSS
jgi:hypothetical protein